MSRAGEWMRRAVWGVLLAALVAGFYWKLVFSREYTWLQSPDIAYQVLPWFQMQAREWHAGRMPLWDPYLWCGQPLFGQVQPAAAFPLNWLLFLLPLDNGFIARGWLHWYYVALHFLAAWGGYRLAREIGATRGAALISASVFSFMGWTGAFDWPQMLAGAVCLPWSLLYLLRVWRGERLLASSLYAGFFLGLAWLGGHHQLPMFFSAAAAGIWLCVLWRRKGERAAFGAFALFWLMVAATGAFQMLPAQEYGKYAVRWAGTEEPLTWKERVPHVTHRQYNFPPVALLGILFPGFWTNNDPFLGWCGALLVLAGVVSAWHRRGVRLLVFLGLGALFYAMAGYSVFHGLLYALVPHLEKARNPSFAMFLFHLSAAALAGLGANWLATGPEGVWPRRLRMASLWFALGVFTLRAGWMLARGFSTDFDDRHLAVALAAVLFAGVLRWTQRGGLAPGAATSLLLLLVLFEAGLNTTYHWPSRQETNRTNYLEQHTSLAGVAGFLRAQEGLPRVMVERRVIPFNAGAWFGFSQSEGYLASLTENWRRHGQHNAATTNLLGITHRVSDQPDPRFPELVFEGEGGIKVWRNPAAFPRAFAVHEAVALPSYSHVYFFISDANRDWRKATFLLGDLPKLEPCAAANEVGIVAYEPSRVRLRARMGCRGMVILTDTFYPGWKALVDGKEVPIHEAYALVRGVVVEAGEHEIEFRYRPASVIWGGVLTALAAMAVLLFRIAEIYRRR